MARNLTLQVANPETTPQKIPEKPVDEEEKKEPLSLDSNGSLQYYSKLGDIPAMRKAFEAGAKVTVPEGPQKLPGEGPGEEDENYPITGDYPLHMAAGGGHQEALQEILNWEADIEAKNRIGSTALHRAVSNDQVDIVKRLLKEGASIETTNKIGNTALHCAAYTGSQEVAKLLIEAQALAHINQPNKFGATPLMYAAKSSSSLCKYFLSLRPGRFQSETDKKETKEIGLGKRSSGQRSSTEKRSSLIRDRALTGNNRALPGDNSSLKPYIVSVQLPDTGVELTILASNPDDISELP